MHDVEPQNFAPSLTETLTCESCGKDFSCGAKVGKCWCFALELEENSRAEIAENFKNCLCQDCLENLNKNAKIDSVKSP